MDPPEKGNRIFDEAKKSAAFGVVKTAVFASPFLILAVAMLFGFKLRDNLPFLDRYTASPIEAQAASIPVTKKHAIVLTKDWSMPIERKNRKLSFYTIPAEAEIEVYSPSGCIRLGRNSVIPWELNPLVWRVCNDQPYETVKLFYEITD